MKDLTDRIKEIGERELEGIKPDPSALEQLKRETVKNRRSKSKFQFFTIAAACVMLVITFATATFLLLTPSQKYGDVGSMTRYRIPDQVWDQGVREKTEFPVEAISGFYVWAKTQFVTVESKVDVAYEVHFNRTFTDEEDRLERDSYEITMLYRDCHFPYVYDFTTDMTEKEINGATVLYKVVNQEDVLYDTYITFATTKCRYYLTCSEVIYYGHVPCTDLLDIAAQIIENAESVTI